MGNRLVYKFFVEDEAFDENIVKITGDNQKHIGNVLRMKAGDEIYLVNKENGKCYKCILTTFSKDNILSEILEEEENNMEPKVKVDLFQGLTKSDKLEYVIQKSVELGVNKIFPVKMKNCIAIIKDEAKKNERWNKISEAAAKQSKRGIIPKVENTVDISYICSNIAKYDLVIVAYENEEKNTIKEILQEYKEAKNIAIIIGPEGGIEGKEIEKMLCAGAKAVTLGSRILRTETAPIAVLSMIMYEYDL